MSSSNIYSLDRKLHISIPSLQRARTNTHPVKDEMINENITLSSFKVSCRFTGQEALIQYLKYPKAQRVVGSSHKQF